MIKWFHHLLNPHCAECRIEHECQSCATLLTEVARLRQDNDRLLSRLLEKPKEEVDKPPVEINTPLKNIPWRVRQQILEAEDREKAKILKNAPKPTEELERELGVASKA